MNEYEENVYPQPAKGVQLVDADSFAGKLLLNVVDKLALGGIVLVLSSVVQCEIKQTEQTRQLQLAISSVQSSLISDDAKQISKSFVAAVEFLRDWKSLNAKQVSDLGDNFSDIRRGANAIDGIAGTKSKLMQTDFVRLASRLYPRVVKYHDSTPPMTTAERDDLASLIDRDVSDLHKQYYAFIREIHVQAQRSLQQSIADIPRD